MTAFFVPSALLEAEQAEKERRRQEAAALALAALPDNKCGVAEYRRRQRQRDRALLAARGYKRGPLGEESVGSFRELLRHPDPAHVVVRRDPTQLVGLDGNVVRLRFPFEHAKGGDP